MKLGFYLRIAVNNLRKNSQTYVPYILTCIVTIMMHYMMKSLSLNPGITNLYGAGYVAYMLTLGCHVIEIFAVIFLIYTNSFLIKRRKKEFALYLILGMEKKHLSFVLFLETVLVYVVSALAGLALGIALDKAMFLLIFKFIGTESAPLGFFISPKAVLTSAKLLGAVYLVIYVKNLFTIQTAKPVELLRGGSMGEKEPRTKWIMAVLGVFALGAGYYLALTVQSPVTAMTLLFVAVISVIIGTYLLFTAGSIAILKIMRRNKRFYYKADHFISVSGMIYRMKQNAVGLANICILSTMVLVMVSSTTSMMVGMDDIIHTRYPNDYCVYSNAADKSANRQIFDEITKQCGKMGVKITQKQEYAYGEFAVVQDGDSFRTDGNVDTVQDMENIRILFFIPLSDYNDCMGTGFAMEDGQLMMYDGREDYGYPLLRIYGMEFAVEHVDRMINNGSSVSNVATTHYCILTDRDFYTLLRKAKGQSGITGTGRRYLGLDVKADDEAKELLRAKIKQILSDAEAEGQFSGYMETILGQRTSFIALYGGFFFLGVFLGLLFVTATVLIIYYKQISEGYEDKERFAIMQKVGMTKEEVKGAIRSQVLTVFFLPLVVAGIHVSAAFPIIAKILMMLNMENRSLYLTCTALCFLVFALLYVAIYGLTARTYYRIVSR